MQVPTVHPPQTVHDPRFTTAYRRAVGMSGAELASILKHHLGRPLVALATKTPDANTISRWARGVEPNANAKARMQLLATVLFALEDVWDNEFAASHWMTGHNPILGFQMPIDVFARGDYAAVFDAARAIANE